MKVKGNCLVFVFISILLIISCARKEEKRKIKLAREGIEKITATPNKLATTLHFEPEQRRSIAVMYFENKTGDRSLEWMRKGIADMLITDLSQSRYLDVLSTQKLYQILKKLGKEAIDKIDFKVAATIGKEARVEAVLIGSFMKQGDSLRIDVQLHEADTGNLLKTEKVAGKGMEKIFTMVDELTKKIKNDLKLSLREPGEVDRSIADVTTKSVEAYRYYVEGREYTNKLFYKQAISRFEKAVEIDSTFATAYLRLAQSYAALNRIDDAVAASQKAMAFSDRVTERERLDILALEAGWKADLERLIEIYQQKTDLYPFDAEAHFNLGNLYRGIRKYDEAIKEYKKAIDIAPNYKLAYNQLGYAYAQKAWFTQAISVLEKYRSLVPEEPNPYDSMGEIYGWAGEFDKSINACKKALKIKSDFYPALEHLAEAYMDIGEYGKALHYYRKYIDVAPSKEMKAQGHGYRALTYWAMSNTEKAKNELEKGLELFPESPMIIDLIGQVYKAESDTATAIEKYRQWFNIMKRRFKLPFTDVNSLVNVAYISIENKVYIEDIIELLEKTMKEAKNPTLKGLSGFYLGVAYAKAGRYEEAEKIFRSAALRTFFFKDLPDLGWSAMWKLISDLTLASPPPTEQDLKYALDFVEKAKAAQNVPYEVAGRFCLALNYARLGEREKMQREFFEIGAPLESDWLVIGPFTNVAGFDRQYPPEKQIDLKASYHQGKINKITWQKAQDGAMDGYVNLRKIFTPNVWTVAYGVIYVHSPSTREAQLRLGGNESLKLWLNDRLVWKNNQHRGAMIDNDIIPVELKKGVNRILIKVCQRIGDWGFYFRITDPTGKAFDDVKYVPASEL